MLPCFFFAVFRIHFWADCHTLSRTGGLRPEPCSGTGERHPLWGGGGDGHVPRHSPPARPTARRPPHVPRVQPPGPQCPRAVSRNGNRRGSGVRLNHSETANAGGFGRSLAADPTNPPPPFLFARVGSNTPRRHCPPLSHRPFEGSAGEPFNGQLIVERERPTPLSERGATGAVHQKGPREEAP